jgi:hypothetical protein
MTRLFDYLRLVDLSLPEMPVINHNKISTETGNTTVDN